LPDANHDGQTKFPLSPRLMSRTLSMHTCLRSSSAACTRGSRNTSARRRRRSRAPILAESAATGRSGCRVPATRRRYARRYRPPRLDVVSTHRAACNDQRARRAPNSAWRPRYDFDPQNVVESAFARNEEFHESAGARRRLRRATHAQKFVRRARFRFD
jgi:hypothetical protein